MPMSGVVQTNHPVLQAGKFDRRIRIVAPSPAQDTAGGWSMINVTPVLTCWASIRALTASEKFAAHEFASSVTHGIWIRHPRSAVPNGVQAKMIIQYDQRQFQIESVQNPDERTKALLLLCVEIDDSVNQQGAGSLPEGQL